MQYVKKDKIKNQRLIDIICKMSVSIKKKPQLLHGSLLILSDMKTYFED